MLSPVIARAAVEAAGVEFIDENGGGRRRQTKEARSPNEQAVSPFARHRQRSDSEPVTVPDRQLLGLAPENRPGACGSRGAGADSRGPLDPLPPLPDEEPQRAAAGNRVRRYEAPAGWSGTRSFR
jgi:hypothetical protein